MASFSLASLFYSSTAKIEISKTNSLHVLFVKFIFACIRQGVASFPKKLDEFVSFLPCLQLKKNLFFCFSDNRIHKLQPALMLWQEFFFKCEILNNQEEDKKENKILLHA